MRLKFFTVALISAVAASMSMSSCIGSFALTNRLLEWNRNIDSKFVNEVVFFAFWIVPVYEVAALADVIVLNSIEFWSGDSPIADGSKVIIEGNDAKYMVEADSNGYTITNTTTKETTRLNYDKSEQTWSVVGRSGKEYPLMTFVDDTHILVPAGNGEMMQIERSKAGLYAYQTAIAEHIGLFAQK